MISTLSLPPIFPGIFISLYDRCLEAGGMPTLEYTTHLALAEVEVSHLLIATQGGRVVTI